LLEGDRSVRQPTSWWLPSGIDGTETVSVPFHTFLLKIASRCNLDCDYCYVYRSPDQSWKARPRFMTEEVERAAIQRISEHVAEHNIDEVEIVFHGGEPLLAGASRIDFLAEAIRRTVPARVNIGLQTNGTLLCPEILDVLLKHNIRIGLSLDGPSEANDRHRLNHAGESSHHAVIKAIELIRSKAEWEPLYGGLLAVIDLANDPVGIYRYFTSIDARSIDLLLPDYNHDRQPPRTQLGYTPSIAYGQWLARFFEVWFSEKSSLEIKCFEEILILMLGGPSGLESLGLTPVDLVVVETDGDIEPVDTLKTATRVATRLDMNVLTHSFDQALKHPAIVSRMIGADALCGICRSCPELQNCGGGYVPHRYRHINGFLNPSVYCEDLRHLFVTMRRHVLASSQTKFAVFKLKTPQL
jgi:uncharacterized protein